MTLILFAVFDMAAGAFLPPFHAATLELGIRAFRQAANDASHPFCQYSSEYSLFALGEFDQKSGELEVYSEKKSLGVAVQYVDRTVGPEVSDG